MIASFIIHNVDRQAARSFWRHLPEMGTIRLSAFISSDKRVSGEIHIAVVP
jgi:hypothetical protein